MRLLLYIVKNILSFNKKPVSYLGLKLSLCILGSRFNCDCNSKTKGSTSEEAPETKKIEDSWMKVPFQFI